MGELVGFSKTRFRDFADTSLLVRYILNTFTSYCTLLIEFQYVHTVFQGAATVQECTVGAPNTLSRLGDTATAATASPPPVVVRVANTLDEGEQRLLRRHIRVLGRVRDAPG